MAAGDYLAFTYTTARLEPYLVVFNAQRGSTLLDLNLRAGCGPINSPCVNSPCVQAVSAVELARNGWLAEFDPDGSLAATDGHHTTVNCENRYMIDR